MYISFFSRKPSAQQMPCTSQVISISHISTGSFVSLRVKIPTVISKTITHFQIFFSIAEWLSFFYKTFHCPHRLFDSKKIMKKSFLILLLNAAIALAAHSQQKEFGWLKGTWKLKDKPIYEFWKVSADGK